VGLCGNGVLAKQAKRNIPVLPLDGDMLSKLSIVVDWGKCAKGFKPPGLLEETRKAKHFLWRGAVCRRSKSHRRYRRCPTLTATWLACTVPRQVGTGGKPIDIDKMHTPSSQVLQEASFFLVLR
jgi:hypothetical protein